MSKGAVRMNSVNPDTVRGLFTSQQNYIGNREEIAYLSMDLLVHIFIFFSHWYSFMIQKN